MSEIVTVIIPLFNGQQTILRCLDSLKSQTYKNIEVIIVNDGSTDCSAELAKKYIQDNKLNGWQLHTIPNGGVAKARNFGIAMATGEYLCFVDADDYVDIGYVAEMLSALQSSRSDFCISGYKRVSYRNGKEKGKQDCMISDCRYSLETLDEIDETLFINGFIHPCWGKLYKTKLIKDNQITFPDQSLSEDTVFNLNYLQFVHSIKTINYLSYYYIVDIDSVSLSKSFPTNIFDIYIKIHKDYITFFQKYNLDIEVVGRMMYAQYYSAVNKTLFNSQLSSKEKQKILDNAFRNQEVRETFQRKQINKTVAIINGLILCRAYKIAKMVLYLADLKEKYTE